MLHKILLIAKRDYIAVVMRRAFLIGLVVFPLMFGGGFLGLALMRVAQGNAEQRIGIVDHTGHAAADIMEAAKQQIAEDAAAGAAGPAAPTNRYSFVVVPPDEKDPVGQRLALSDRIRRADLFAFVEIAPDGSRASYYASAGNVAGFGPWLTVVVNNGLRRARLEQLGADRNHFEEVFRSAPLDAMTLVSRDEKTGGPRAGSRRNPAEAAVPFVLMLFMAMIAMVGAAPMLAGVAEDKTQRVFEMLLASATPFELIAGKVVASVGCSVTSSVFYLIGAFLALQGMAMMGLAPLELLPWFFIYLICEVVMLSAMGAALGSACSAPRDAQQLVPLMLAQIMIPLFLLTPVAQSPNGPLATAMSFFPPFTPLIMMVRQAMPGGVPAWQPWVGLAGILVWTVLVAWAAARVFRVGILLQGQPPKPAMLLRWALKG